MRCPPKSDRPKTSKDQVLRGLVLGRRGILASFSHSRHGLVCGQNAVPFTTFLALGAQICQLCLHCADQLRNTNEGDGPFDVIGKCG